MKSVLDESLYNKIKCYFFSKRKISNIFRSLLYVSKCNDNEVFNSCKWEYKNFILHKTLIILIMNILKHSIEIQI